jgi:hypothetical protein
VCNLENKYSIYLKSYKTTNDIYNSVAELLRFDTFPVQASIHYAYFEGKKVKNVKTFALELPLKQNDAAP